LKKFSLRKLASESVKSFDITVTKNSPATGVISLNEESSFEIKEAVTKENPEI